MRWIVLIVLLFSGCGQNSDDECEVCTCPTDTPDLSPTPAPATPTPIATPTATPAATPTPAPTPPLYPDGFYIQVGAGLTEMVEVVSFDVYASNRFSPGTYTILGVFQTLPGWSFGSLDNPMILAYAPGIENRCETYITNGVDNNVVGPLVSDKRYSFEVALPAIDVHDILDPHASHYGCTPDALLGAPFYDLHCLCFEFRLN